MQLWQKILLGIAISAFLYYTVGVTLLVLAAIIMAVGFTYDRRRRRPSLPEPQTAPVHAETPEQSAVEAPKTVSSKLPMVIGGTAAVLTGLAFLWVLPYLIAVVSLGAICPWTPPGITDPGWSCSSSSSPKGDVQLARSNAALRGYGKLAFAMSSGKGTAADIFVVNTDGTGLRNLTTTDGVDYRGPAWSPEGSELALVAGSHALHGPDIEVRDARGGIVTPLTEDGFNEDPAWSPDGKTIAYAGARLESPADTFRKQYEIYVRRGDGAALLLTHNAEADEAPSWSPDGKSIAFTRGVLGSREVYVMTARGAAQTNLSLDPADDGDPAWSPKGSEIAFVSDRGGSSQVYVMAADGSGIRRLTHGSGAKSNPAWSADGRKIAFINHGDNAIYVINPDGTQMRPFLTGVDSDGGLSWQPRAPATS